MSSFNFGHVLQVFILSWSPRKFRGDLLQEEIHERQATGGRRRELLGMLQQHCGGEGAFFCLLKLSEACGFIVKRIRVQ